MKRLFLWSAFLVVLSVGIYARLPTSPFPYLWLDEAHRAYHILSNDSLQSLLASARTQANVFVLPNELVLGRLGLALFGVSELAFRLWPFLYGVAGIVAAFLLLRRLGLPVAGLLAALLIAIGPDFILHAREFKPYAMDLALALWSLCAAVGLSASRRRNDILLAGILCVCALSTVTFAFVFPAVAVYRVWVQRRRGPGDLALLAVPAALFAAMLFFLARPMLASTGILDFWASYYPSSLDSIRRSVTEHSLYVRGYFVLGAPAAWLAYLVGVPLITLKRRDGMGLLLVGPFIVHALASALGLYPLFQRPSYYLYGLMVVGFAYTVGGLLEIVARRFPPPASIAASALCVAAVVGYAIYADVIPDRLLRVRRYPPDAGRAITEILVQRYHAGDLVAMNYGFRYTYGVYRERLISSAPSLAQLGPMEAQPGIVDRSVSDLCRSLRAYPRPATPGTRLWLITTHVPFAYEHYQELLPRIGQLETLHASRSQSLMLLTLTRALSSLSCADPI